MAVLLCLFVKILPHMVILCIISEAPVSRIKAADFSLQCPFALCIASHSSTHFGWFRAAVDNTALCVVQGATPLARLVRPPWHRWPPPVAVSRFLRSRAMRFHRWPAPEPPLDLGPLGGLWHLHPRSHLGGLHPQVSQLPRQGACGPCASELWEMRSQHSSRGYVGLAPK